MPRITFLYQYMYPDDVTSALHFDELSQYLASKNWYVEALPSNRSCHNKSQKYSQYDFYKGVHYKRIWRPKLNQHTFWGRLLNSIWMILCWSKIIFRRKTESPDLIVIGTDPLFSILIAIPLKFFTPNTRIIHWCFDLYPEAAIAKGIIKENSTLIKILKKMLSKAYLSCDLIVDIGSCMKSRLSKYNHKSSTIELTPWAHVEPNKIISKNRASRILMFGKAKIGLLYSGNLGEAHNFDEFLSLARLLRKNKDIHICFSIRGILKKELQESLTPEDTNITIIDFVPIDQLESHLGSADFHLVSIKEKWSGIVLPSKFFGSIAMGRPIIYSGPLNCALAKWIKKFEIGLIIDPNNIQKTIDVITDFSKNSHSFNKLKKKCHYIYNKNFSKKIILQKWYNELSELLNKS